jgi:hypothetical protein
VLIADFTGRTFLSGTDEEGGSSIEAFLLEPEPGATEPNGARVTGPVSP